MRDWIAKCISENVGHADSRRDRMDIKPQVGLTYRSVRGGRPHAPRLSIMGQMWTYAAHESLGKP